MPNNTQLDEFPTTLRDVTIRKRIRWEQTPDLNTFRVQLPNRSWARISKEWKEDDQFRGHLEGEWYYLLELLSEKGHVLQEWAALAAGAELSPLFEAARESALRPDETLDEAVRGLKQLLEPVPRDSTGKPR